jgi:L-cysteine desulfidase
MMKQKSKRLIRSINKEIKILKDAEHSQVDNDADQQKILAMVVNIGAGDSPTKKIIDTSAEQYKSNEWNVPSRIKNVASS